MAETLHTTNRSFPYPTKNDFVEETPSEVEELAKHLDEENTGDIDFLQTGVVSSSDWEGSWEINAATGAVKRKANMGGTAWLPLAAIGLCRSVTAAARPEATGSKPATGKYAVVGVELTPSTWGGPATLSATTTGAEQTTQKAAEEHVPAVTAGSIRIYDLVVLNTAGVYSIVTQWDRRTAVVQSFSSGDLKLSAASAAQFGFLKCEGQAVKRGQYLALFAAIGTTYGEGDKSTTFNVPNYVERVPMGPGGTNALGAKLGEATHVLSSGEMPSHSHGVTDPGHAHEEEVVYSDPGSHQGGDTRIMDDFVAHAFAKLTSLISKTGISIQNTGGGAAHNNIQPSTVCNVWIKF